MDTEGTGYKKLIENRFDSSVLVPCSQFDNLSECMQKSAIPSSKNGVLRNYEI